MGATECWSCDHSCSFPKAGNFASAEATRGHENRRMSAVALWKPSVAHPCLLTFIGLFLSLTGISGVGAKTALGLLGAMPLRDVEPRDSARRRQRPLSSRRASAKRRRSESRWNSTDKVTQADINQPTGKTATPTSGAAADNFAEAIEALTALGYSAIEARDALSHVEDKDAQVDELIRMALRAMAGMRG